MSELTRRTWLTTLGLVPVAGAASAWAAEDAAQPRQQWMDIDPREQFRLRHFPNVELTTHNGKRVRLYDDLLKNRKVVINMIYVNCAKICSLVTMNLAHVQALLGDRVGRDIFFYSISLKPEEDTPAVLKKHARMHRARRGWLFLTGKGPDIEMVRRGLGFTYDDPVEDADTSNHVGMLRIGNEPLIRWATCPGQANPKHIARTILTEFGYV